VLGRVLGLFAQLPTVSGPPPEVEALVAERGEARKQRDFKRADSLREAIHRLGWVVEDTPTGPRVAPRAT
jgi:cysteinyl-tRNA synthetase